MQQKTDNVQNSRPPQGKKHHELLEQIVKNNNVFIDASALMHKGFRQMETLLFLLLQQNRKRLIIPQRAIEILEKDRNAAARYAMSRIRYHAGKNLVDVCGDESDGDAKTVLINVFTKNVHQHNLALITQDGDLSHDILRLNERKSLKPRENQAHLQDKNGEALVFRFNEEGTTLIRPGSNTLFVDLSELLQEDTLLLMDTSSLMMDSFRLFEKELFTTLRNAGKHLIIMDDVIFELEAHVRKQKKAAHVNAAYALSSLRQYQLMDLVVIPGEDRHGAFSHFADRTTLTVIRELRQRYAVVLIVQDIALAHDVLELNQSRSQRGVPVSVYRLNESNGRLSIQLGDVERQEITRAWKALAART